ncbi:indolepyruvate ferredoxin oxidoreductase subunit alpha [Methanosarcina sp. MSH10X1]|uniref:thiamine pyrophosphate-dependent enzyme n=1 Tax=Methanosarcina sp. MSH10X1 TaxID=2507075 RepID=UPI000FFC0F0D|nr:indolepyruvate ferredoxin oxidoreductase subunit alpha [Methanosarcina sp. MSH10X1]RXA21730.1 indolepyruvate ferredoxin oxidoreductase subunit alpha [Methanosarcina sp. MSH10X1]
MRKEKEALECTGFEALYFAALDSDVSLITGVPGYPVTSLMELFLKNPGEKEPVEASGAKNPVSSLPVSGIVRDYSARWLTNEKVALEIALGASVSGRRALVLVKHVGMNLLSDPLITSVTHTIGAGLVIIAGDDPGAKGSQNEQDSRWYGRIAEIAVFDPANPYTAYRALRRAYELSEETRTPVILRVTAGLEKSKGKIKRHPAASAPYPEFDRAIWKNRMVEKHRLFHARTYPMLEKEAEDTDLNKIRGRTTENTDPGETKERTAGNTGHGSGRGYGQVGIISSGFTSSIVEEILERRIKTRDWSSCPEISHLSLSLVNPLPLEKIKAFLESNRRVLVAEESEPFIEEQIRIAGRVYGKKTGHLPYGEIRTEDLEFALEHMGEEISSPPGAALARTGGRALICSDCPYLPLYRLLSTLDVRIAGDMGCSVRSAPEPLAAVDVSFALGSAVSVACGFDKKGIAVIGDFALAHSGILGLLSAATTGCNMLVLVLQNEVAAMTGGQTAPDLRKVVEAITPDVSIFDIDTDEEEVPDKTGKEIDRNEKVTGETGKMADKTGHERESGHEIENRIPNTRLSELIRAKLELPGLSVIFIKGKCRKY